MPEWDEGRGEGCSAPPSQRKRSAPTSTSSPRAAEGHDPKKGAGDPRFVQPPFQSYLDPLPAPETGRSSEVSSRTEQAGLSLGSALEDGGGSGGRERRSEVGRESAEPGREIWKLSTRVITRSLVNHSLSPCMSTQK